MRRGIRSLLELAGGFEVIGGEAADGDEAIVIIPMHPSRALPLACGCREQNGLDVLRELLDAGDLPPTILLTTFDDDEALLVG